MSADEFFKNSNSESVTSAQTPSPDWIRRMRDDYQRTGRYRIEDVRRLLGDQSQPVSSSSTRPEKT